jgi:hypothetical protein
MPRPIAHEAAMRRESGRLGMAWNDLRILRVRHVVLV